MNWAGLIQQLEIQTGLILQPFQISSVSGGDINSAYKLQAGQQIWFIKLNRANLLDMFVAEAAGLKALANTNTVKVPEVVCSGVFEQYSFLLLNYICLSPLNPASLSLFGEQLAALHSQTQPYFGWQQNNTIGSTPQSNTAHTDWVSFWRTERLEKQLQLAANKGYKGVLQTQGQKLLTKLDDFFVDYHPQPAFLHGDLWAGNAAQDTLGNPVMFDPACYFGDREADLAMTELFGGFGKNFYAAYHASYPLDTGYIVRKTLYNLYHILNHLNLFGGAYLSQSQGMIAGLLAEVGH